MQYGRGRFPTSLPGCAGSGRSIAWHCRCPPARRTCVIVAPTVGGWNVCGCARCLSNQFTHPSTQCTHIQTSSSCPQPTNQSANNSIRFHNYPPLQRPHHEHIHILNKASMWQEAHSTICNSVLHNWLTLCRKPTYTAPRLLQVMATFGWSLPYLSSSMARDFL